jgi:hypothetical protein
MIETAMNDLKIRQLMDMPGENEAIMTGKLFGIYPWKIRLDKYVSSPRIIIDWKTAANFTETKWNNEYGAHVSFIRNFNYIMRAAVYIEIEKQFTGNKVEPAFLLVCISKQDPPDKDIFSMNHRQELEMELEKMEKNLGRIQRLKEGLHKPTRCGYCAYCRGSKQIREIKPFFVLDPAERPPREEDYAMPPPVDPKDIERCDTCKYDFPDCVSGDVDVVYGSDSEKGNIIVCSAYEKEGS